MPSANFSIRLIEKKDNPVVAALIRDVMPQFGAVGDGFAINDPEVDRMYETYQEERSRYYVIEVAGKVRGSGGVAPLKGGGHEVSEIQKMYFYEDLRGKGAGSALMDRLLADAKSFGFKTVYLETMVNMTAAQSMYHHKGFKRLDMPLGRTGHCGCDVWFAKEI